MFIKNIKRTSIVKVFIILIVFLLSAGCLTSSTDETQIKQIAKNIEKAIEKKDVDLYIEKAIEKKDVDLFMENISYNYSDEDGGTYDNHINGLPEEIFSKIEEAEDLADILSIFKIEPKVIIPESDLVFADIYASGKMTIKISLKACIFWVVCTDLYNENIQGERGLVNIGV